MSTRFDYVRYDEEKLNMSTYFKDKFISVEGDIEELLDSPRAKALALTALEETYMWIGKAIRDDQIAKNGSAPLQEERTNS
jgi:hypothetical protein